MILTELRELEERLSKCEALQKSEQPQTGPLTKREVFEKRMRYIRRSPHTPIMQKLIAETPFETWKSLKERQPELTKNYRFFDWIE